jgi:hypothetical protein
MSSSLLCRCLPVLLLERSGSVNGAFTLAGYQHMFNLLLVSAVIAMLACCFIAETFPTASLRTSAD